jgi:outer membrane protein
MLRATKLILLSLAFVMPAVAAPRFAVVRITEIYQNLNSTHTMLQELQKDRAEILKDERAVHLRNVLEELKQLQSQLQSKRDAPVDDTLRKLAQQYEIKRQEGQTLQEEFQVFDAEKRKEINRKMVTSMRASLTKIDETARIIAQEQGYDVALDSSANSNTGVPILLYAKNAPDITKDVVARLQDAGETSRTPATNPAPLPEEAPAAPAAPAAPGVEAIPQP